MSQSNKKKGQKVSFDVSDELSKNLTFSANVEQKIILTTEDKIHLVLIESKKNLTSQRNWLAPFGILLSCVTTLCTSEFKDTFIGNKEFLQAIFALISLFCLGWLILSLIDLCKSFGKNDIKKIIEQIALHRSQDDKKPQESAEMFIYPNNSNKQPNQDNT